MLFHTGRSLDHRNPTGAQHAASAISGFLIVCCSDCTPASFPYASASFTHSHTLSLDSCGRPTAGKPSSPAGLSTLVYAHVHVQSTCNRRSRLRARLPLSILLYNSSSTHRFPDERTPIEATPLSATSAELGLGLGLGLGWLCGLGLNFLCVCVCVCVFVCVCVCVCVYSGRRTSATWSCCVCVCVQREA